MLLHNTTFRPPKLTSTLRHSSAMDTFNTLEILALASAAENPDSLHIPNEPLPIDEEHDTGDSGYTGYCVVAWIPRPSTTVHYFRHRKPLNPLVQKVPLLTWVLVSLSLLPTPNAMLCKLIDICRWIIIIQSCLHRWRNRCFQSSTVLHVLRTSSPYPLCFHIALTASSELPVFPSTPSTDSFARTLQRLRHSLYFLSYFCHPACRYLGYPSPLNSFACGESLVDSSMYDLSSHSLLSGIFVYYQGFACQLKSLHNFLSLAFCSAGTIWYPFSSIFGK